MTTKQQTIYFISQIISTYYHYAHVEGYYTSQNKMLTQNIIQNAYSLALHNKHEFLECAEYIYDIVENQIKQLEGGGDDDGPNNSNFKCTRLDMSKMPTRKRSTD